MALPIRTVIGRQDFAVKPLEKNFYMPSIATKASILSNGKVTLFLDIEKLFENEAGDGINENNNGYCKQ